MRTLIKTFAVGSIAVAGLILSSVASAAPIVCLNTTDGRYMTLDSVVGGPATCHSAGLVNEPSPFAGQPLLWKIEFDPADTDGPGPNPFLSFSFTGGDIESKSGSLSLIAGLTNHFIVFKFGNGGGDPDWFAYAVNGMTAADWAFFSNSPSTTNALSHVSIYGPGVTVPEPSALALLGLGLVAVGFRARRRHKV